MLKEKAILFYHYTFRNTLFLVWKFNEKVTRLKMVTFFSFTVCKVMKYDILTFIYDINICDVYHIYIMNNIFLNKKILF